MLPDLLACSALVTLAIYHLMIYWGRRKDPEEVYNLFFVIFVLSATLFIVAPYFQPQFFLYSFKPSWLYVINMEMFLPGLLFLQWNKISQPAVEISCRAKKVFLFHICRFTILLRVDTYNKCFRSGILFQIHHTLCTDHRRCECYRRHISFMDFGSIGKNYTRIICKDILFRIYRSYCQHTCLQNDRIGSCSRNTCLQSLCICCHPVCVCICPVR